MAEVTRGGGGGEGKEADAGSGGVVVESLQRTSTGALQPAGSFGEWRKPQERVLTQTTSFIRQAPLSLMGDSQRLEAITKAPTARHVRGPTWTSVPAVGDKSAKRASKTKRKK